MRALVLVLVLAVSLLFLSTVKFGPVQVVASNEGPVHNLRTGNNYTSITSAIADVQTVDGDIIFVENGVYNERLYINKSLSLKGESHDNTTIDGGGNGPVMQVITGGVNISNFNIRNAGTSGPSVAGIFVNGSANCVFTNLTIQNTGYGLLLLDSDGSKIENNSMLKAGEGIVALNSNSTVLLDNDVVDGQFGLALTNSTGCIMRRNHVTNCSDGFGVGGSVLEQFINNVDTSNTIDGKFIYYLLNQSDLVINPSTFPNVGSITVVNSTDVVVENLTLTRSGIFVNLAFTSNSIVRNIAASNSSTGAGIAASSGKNLTIIANRIASCFFGINLEDCQNTTVKSNAISGNSFIAIALRSAHDNLIIGNNVTNYERCIDLIDSANNTIYHNNFANYTEAYSDGHPNIWDNGFEGNYWSDYLNKYPNATQIDSSGIWNTPYVIDANNTDHYPLTTLYAIPEFPSLLALPLFMIATLLAVIVYRRKHCA